MSIYNTPVASLEPNSGDIDGFYILKDVSVRSTAAGKPYLQCKLADTSGEIPAVCWEYSEQVTEDHSGTIVKVRGEVSTYKGAKQFGIRLIRPATAQDQYDKSAVVPTAPIYPIECMDYVWDLVRSIEDPDYRCVAEEMLARHGKEFEIIPAAKSVHHSFVNGLLMHTTNMLKSADHLAHLYKDVVDRSLLITGTLLHDFSKREEYLFSDLGLVTDMSVKGSLLGHLVMGAMEVAEIARAEGIPEEKSVLVQHMLLSHHGKPEFGAAVVPMCAEAELLSMIDLLDSRMEIYAETLHGMEVGEMSHRNFALEHKVYKHM